MSSEGSARATRANVTVRSRPLCRSIALASCLCGALLLAGCGTVSRLLPDRLFGSGKAATSMNEQIADVAAVDMAGLVAQLFEPQTTTFQIPQQMGSFRRSLMSELVSRGYGVQQVSADQGAHFIRHHSSQGTGVDGQPAQRHELSIGDIELGRAYRRIDGEVLPVGPVTMAGRRAPVQLDDSHWQDKLDNPGTVSRILYQAPERWAGKVPAISLITDDVVNRVRGTVGLEGIDTNLQALNSSQVEINNLFFGQSSFSTFEQRYAAISRDVIVFGDDSLRLGADGKQLIREIVEAYREPSDMISLVGCSNGPTRHEDGNEGLALGRSQRVAEEFLAMGVARDRILDQGCWAPVSAGDRFPSRGVVVELLRDKR